MMAADRSGSAHSIGWLTSLSLHATLALGGLLVTQRITLAPQPAPFTWNVAMITEPSTPLQPSPAPPEMMSASATKTPSRVPKPNASLMAGRNDYTNAETLGNP